ncbi:MAG: hypothetical protein EXQ99_07305 [Alphaproteobacteria bacterium]|nr:hypothetical protein [Alphaproteobacteria bacterium]
MERHAWAAAISMIDAHAFTVVDGLGGFIHNDTLSSIIVTPRMSKSHRLPREIIRFREGLNAMPRVKLGSWRQHDVRKIVGTNKRSTLSNKKDATLKVKLEKAGQAQQPGRSEVAPSAYLALDAVGWRSHSASTTMDSRVR